MQHELLGNPVLKTLFITDPKPHTTVMSFVFLQNKYHVGRYNDS